MNGNLLPKEGKIVTGDLAIDWRMIRDAMPNERLAYFVTMGVEDGMYPYILLPPEIEAEDKMGSNGPVFELNGKTVYRLRLVTKA